jgi:formate hydrogenlyase subunit 3/multisubunit Na+/H+ antiporter MnhD subunit
MLTIALAGAALELALGVCAVIIVKSAAASRIIYGAIIVVTTLSLAAALTHLLSAAPAENLTLPVGLPWLGAHFRLDALSAFFLAVVDLGAASASLFALGYGHHEPAPGRILPFYPAFLAGMMLVVLADDAFTFLFSWEFMSLTSWALVMAHHRVPDNVRAGYVYLVMASFGTLTLLLAFGLLAGPDGLYAFAQMRAAHPSAMIGALAIILALIGAGSKAGIVPLHAWLPLAHPAAPSHVSALMSGVMTKVAVYGFVRIAFELAGPPAWWLSVVVLALAGITTFMGVLYALMQHDLKRLLAYHTVENIGIIFIGIWLALAFKAHGLLVFVFIAMSGMLAAFAIHRLASDRLRRAPAWDCGYPDPSPATQYTATSFAEPIRRVFGTVMFRAREQVEMPPPGDTRPARLTVQMTDPIWDWLYAPLAAAVSTAAERLNRLQFLTIRQFLTLVFCALVILLLVLAVWS